LRYLKHPEHCRDKQGGIPTEDRVAGSLRQTMNHGRGEQARTLAFPRDRLDPLLTQINVLRAATP